MFSEAKWGTVNVNMQRVPKFAVAHHSSMGRRCDECSSVWF